MLILSLTSFLITIPNISSKMERRLAESHELPEIGHIDNFLAGIQSQLNDGQTRLDKMNELVNHTVTTDVHDINENEAFGPKDQKVTTNNPDLEPSSLEAHTTSSDSTGPGGSSLNETADSLQHKNLGYFSVAFEFFLKLIVTKKPSDVTAVVSHSKKIFEQMLSWGKFNWIGEAMTKVVRNIVTAFSDLPHSHYIGAMEEFHHEIETRRQTYRPEVNEIFDAADILIEKANGEDLFNILIKFQGYPSVNIDAETLCRFIMEAFNVPFLKLEGTNKLKELMMAANKALLKRFPLIERRMRRQDYGMLKDLAEKRVSLLTHVDIFLSGLQDILQQSNGVIKDISEDVLASNETFIPIDTASDHSVLPPVYNETLLPTVSSIQTVIPPESTSEEILPSELPLDTVNNAETSKYTNESNNYFKNIQFHGYLSFAWQKFWAQVILKKAEDVASVLKHFKSIINRKIKDGSLDWMGESLKRIVFGIASAFSDLPISLIIHSAPGVYTDMKYRHKMFSPEVNEIIDFANNLIQKEDGDYLIQVIKEFENFPDAGSKTNKQLCVDLIEAFERPFLKNPEGAAELKKMVDEVKPVPHDVAALKSLMTIIRSGSLQNNITRKFLNSLTKKNYHLNN